MYRAWIKNGWRLAFNVREIRRGKNKGRFEVFFKRGLRLVRAIVPADALREV